MDIISAHRQGLIEKLELECADLAGRPRDFGQRAIVLHHLYDHSQGGHCWALVEARRQMAIERILQQLEGRADRWWRSRRSCAAAAEAVRALRMALGAEAARRTARAYAAYRMAGTPALADALAARTAPDHAAALLRLHAFRRDGITLDREAAHQLAEAVEADLGHDPQGGIAAALQCADATFLGRAAREALRATPLAKAIGRFGRKGWANVERALRMDPFLPAAFRANPAQHFFALQHGLADRRRKEWVEGESVLAA